MPDDSEAEDEHTMDADEYTPEEGRSVPPLKIKLPPREKSKRSSKRSKGEYDESVLAGGDDDDFLLDNTASTSSSSSRSKSKRSSERTRSVVPETEPTVNNPPTRRSERIFVSATKKVNDPEDEPEEEFSNSSNNKDVIDFKIIHKDYCQGCRQGGELILCDYCPRAYHKVCIDDEIEEIPDDWCCPHCTKNGKPDPKELREQQAALVARKKKKQKDFAVKQQAAAAAASTSGASTSKGKPAEIENRDYCEICNQVGELLLCDTCPRAYHLICMDMAAAPSGNWSCPHCDEHGIDSTFSELQAVEEKVEKAEKIVCKGCRQTGGEIVFCATCPARYHIHCMNPPLDEVPETWHCMACSVEPLKGKVQRIITWRWKKPPSENDADGKSLSAEDSTKNLLKNLKNRKPREREFFVKWKDMSYWHCSWVDEPQLQVFHNGMHRFFVAKNDMNNPPLFDEGGSITTDISHDDGAPKVEDEEGMSEYLRGISSSNAVKHRRRKRASCLPPEVEDNYVRYGIKPDWLLIHRLVNHRKSRGKMFYVIKWRELPYEEVTVEQDPDNCEFPIPEYQKKIDEYWALRRTVEEENAIENDHHHKSSKSKHKEDKRKKDKKGVSKKGLGSVPKSDPKKKWETQPDYIPEPLKLHEYQKEGINWLRFSWANGIDTILADEMGLGKTIQTVVFLYSLYKEGHTRGPFLIAAPLSTIINWERELEDWCPEFYTVNYTGNKDSRIIIRENELSFDADATRSSQKATRIRKHVPVKFHVLLTSYELINADSALLGSIDWKVLVVDEAHRLKSNQSLFFRTLNAYNVGHKLLLTGTPLQNNLEELFNLLNFLSPNRFNDMDGFLSEFSDIAKEEQVKKLHDLLGSHLLRRLKADVLEGMPAKSEFILRVDLAPLQKKYYKYILTRNFDALNSKGGGKQVSLLNIVMDLKKCCNHPYLFPLASEEAPKTKFGYFEGTPLVKACGKLIVLQKMLRKLKNDGNRVLIFSQMTQMLDILEDFLDAEGYKFERIDGSITGSVRQEAIDRFNAPGAQQFVFLLSTRAGGLGINLATADTVIIYDSDWNPHNDIQALSRAHRIGQTNKVMIYRFVTRNSVEERITQVAKKKMMLTHLVVRPGLGSKTTTTTMSKQELDDILKFGTEELFKEEEGKESESAIHYDDKAIEELLDRSNEGIEQKEMWADEYMSSFKVASYQTKEAEEEEEEEPEEPAKPVREEQDPHYWEKLLGIHYIQYQDNISRSLGKGKRVRKQVNYMDHASGQHEFQNADTSESSDFSMPSDVSENDEDFDERLDGLGARGNQKTLRKSTKEKMPPLISTVGSNTEVLGFTPKHRKLFLDLVMRFGLPNLEHAISDSQFFVRELKTKPEKHLRAYASLFISHLCEPGDPSSTAFEDGVPKEGLNVGQVLTRIGIISLIRRKVFEYQFKHGLVSLKLPKPKLIAPAPLADDDDDIIEITPKATAENGDAKDDDDDIIEILPNAPENGTATPGEPAEKESEQSKAEDGAKEEEVSAAEKDVEAMEVDGEEASTEKTDESKKNGDEKDDADKNGDEKEDDVKEKVVKAEDEEKPKVVKADEQAEDVEMKDADEKVKSEETEDDKSAVKKESKSEEGSKESSTSPTENEDSQQSTAKSTSSEVELSSVKEDDENTASTTASTSNGVPESKLPPKKVIEEVDLEAEEDVEDEEEVTEVKDFDFTIQDGGLTELHTLWYYEEKELKPRREHEIWNRRHDFWMLSGIVKHGYEMWDAIANDEDFLIVSEPFKTSLGLRNKFMERRLRLLEQALVFEEQLRRYNHLNGVERLVEKPKEEVEVLEVPSKEAEPEDEEGEAASSKKKKVVEEIDLEAEDDEDVEMAVKDGEEEGQTNGEKNGDSKEGEKKKETNGDVKEGSETSKSKSNKKSNGDVGEEDKENNEDEEVTPEENMILNPMIQRAANQLEDLLIDMKSDCARIPQTVQRIPSIANRLQLNTNDQQGHHSHIRPAHAGSSRQGHGGNQQPLAGMPQSMLNRMM